MEADELVDNDSTFGGDRYGSLAGMPRTKSEPRADRGGGTEIRLQAVPRV